MLLTGYETHKEWRTIRRNADEGKSTILTQIKSGVKQNKKWKRTYTDNLKILDEMVRHIAIRATDFTRQNWDDYAFGYGERQLDSILVPVFWDIVGRRQGLVLVQYPTKRKAMKYALPEGERQKSRTGWVDYRLRRAKTSYALEIKSVSSSEKLGNKERIIKEWNDALNKLDRICYKKQIKNLGSGSIWLFKSVILFIPVFINARSHERERVKVKNVSEIDGLLTKNLEALLGEFKPVSTQPDWIACWLLPEDLQEDWQDDTDTDKYWQSPAVLILAKLCEKWEQNDKQRWVKV